MPQHDPAPSTSLAALRTSPPDAIYLTVGILISILSAGRVPSVLGLTPEMVSYIGAALVASAGALRLWLDPTVLQSKVTDAIAMAVGVVMAALTYAGIVLPMTADDLAMLGGGAASILALLRARFVRPLTPVG